MQVQILKRHFRDKCMKTALLRRWLFASFTVMLLLAGVASGQTPGTGAISGVVLDPANRAVANAEVLVSDDATHISRSVTTTAEGVFRVPLLPPGKYSVTVKAPHFAPNTSPSIPVAVSDTTTLNVTLAVAGTSTNIQVSSNAEVAQLESSTLGGVVDETAILSLPLASRNYTQILGLAPGVVVDLPNAAQLGRGTQNVASNGATPTANNIQFNGIDANNLVQNSAANAESSQVGTAIPAPDSIQEFRRADGKLRCRVWTRDRGECRSGQQERHEQLPRKRMGVSAQQHLQRERFLLEAQRSASTGSQAEPVWRVGGRTHCRETRPSSLWPTRGLPR